MARRMNYPRNEAARRDRIAQHEIVHGLPRNHQGRNDAIAGNPYGAAGITVALSGTAISEGVTEEQVVAGGETVVLDLIGDTFHPDLGGDNAVTTAFIAGITGDDEGGNGFDDEVTLTHAAITRNSATQVTIVLPAAGSYAITEDETVSVVVPGSALAKGNPAQTATFTITANVTITLTGTAIAGGVLESEIVTGGETIIITLAGDTWAATVGDDNAITDALIAGITGDDEGGNGFNDEVTVVHGNVVRTSDTIVTVTLPAAGSYAIAADETVTVDVPAVAVAGGVPPEPKTFDISNEA